MAKVSDRKPWVAGLLAVLVTGLGHVYCGRATRGVVAYWLLLIGLVSWAVLSVWVDSPVLRITTYGLVLSAWVATVADAIQLARRSSRPFVLRPYNRSLVYVGIALVVGLGLQSAVKSQVSEHIARAYVTSVETMSPTLLAGDNFYAAPLRAENVTRGSIVVFRENGLDYIQRAIGLPGDTIEMRKKKVYANGVELYESYVRHIDSPSGSPVPSMAWQAEYAPLSTVPTRAPTRDDWGPIVIPEGEYLLLGDNRDNSYDGRYRGFVSAEQIFGRPVWVYFSWDTKAGLIRWPRLGMSIR